MAGHGGGVAPTGGLVTAADRDWEALGNYHRWGHRGALPGAVRPWRGGQDPARGRPRSSALASWRPQPGGLGLRQQPQRHRWRLRAGPHTAATGLEVADA